MRTRSKNLLPLCLTTVSLHLGANLSAQTIAQEELLPAVGSTWHMRALQTIPPLPVDAIPTVWTYADLHGNDVFGASFRLLPPTQVPEAAAYPGTDLVLKRTEDEDGRVTRSFFDVRPDGCYELGSTTTNVSSIVASPGMMVMAYPLVYGEPSTADHCLTSVTSTSLTPYCGVTELIFYKTGTLQLAFGEFPDTRLVRTLRTMVNQADPSESTNTETLTWYAPGIPFPLLQFVTVHYANGDESHSGSILDETSVVGLSDAELRDRLPLYPVPSAGEVNIQVMSGGELNIHGTDGRVVFNTRLAASATPVRLDLSMLAPGTYQAVLREQERVVTSAFILAR